MEMQDSSTEDSEQSENPFICRRGRKPGNRAVCVFESPAVYFVLVAVIIILIVAVSVLLVVHSSNPPVADSAPLASSCCPDSWVGYQRKCYYFSKAEGNWTYSRSHCSKLNASLAGIDSEQEKAFLLRYKGKPDHWIGLRRDQERAQPWKWANGSEFNDGFPIRGGGDCAYLNDENGVSSSRCVMPRHWICSTVGASTKGKERTVGGQLHL